MLVRSADFRGRLLDFQIGSGQRQSLTNAARRVFWCTFDGKNLEIGDASAPETPPYLDVLAATDQAGEPVRFGRPMWKGSLGRYQSHSWWLQQSSATLLDVSLAFPKVIKTEFFVKPEQMQ